MSEDPKLPDASNAPAPEALQTQESMSEEIADVQSTSSSPVERTPQTPLKRRTAYKPKSNMLYHME